VIGQTLSHYRITAALGAGGMGEVYRATDTTLGRDVAIKVLPPEVVQDTERLGRFQREAHLLASLNHPNIAAIYGLEEAEGKPFLALELVEGEDLKERLARGAIPLDEALEIAEQVAEALEEAHNKGIVHRDLKPANVKLTPDGKVKVLDFGLAKAWSGEEPDGSSPPAALSQSPTLAHTGTVAGVILGTAAYMSPEQARGKPVDKRADVWSFGVLVWEMLTGQTLFAGDTVTDVIASVVKEEPDLEALPAETPGAVRKLLSRCLRKDPRTRLPDIGAARLELQEIRTGAVAETEAPTAEAEGALRAERSRRARERWAWAAVALVAAGLAAALALALDDLRDSEVSRPAARFEVDAPEGWSLGTDFDWPAPSPDGRQVAFRALPEGQEGGTGGPMLWVRSLDALEARPLAGTEGGSLPFWSPDGRSLAFFTEDELRRLSLADGTVQRVCTLPRPRPTGGDWNEEGTILFSTGWGAAQVYSVTATGGDAKPLTTLDESRGEQNHHMPQFLPDARHFLFLVGGTEERQGLYVATLDSPDDKRQVAPEWRRRLYAAGHLLFVRDGTLLAQPFDADRAALSGEPVAIAPSVVTWAGSAGLGWFGASPGGTLASFAGESVSGQVQLAWVDRKGQQVGTVGAPGDYRQIALSPDERNVALEIPDAEGHFDLWVMDVARGVTSRVTATPANERDPVWSADGRSLAFIARGSEGADLRRKGLRAGDPETVLVDSPDEDVPESWSNDGKTLLFIRRTVDDAQSVWALPVEEGGEPVPVLTAFRVDEPHVSPDGRWIAYVSNESGRDEVYLEAFRREGDRVRVSTDGGGQPKWRGDGKELFFTTPGNRLAAVEVHAAGDRLRVSLPTELFDIQGLEGTGYDDYAPTADGQRFLVKQPIEEGRKPRLQIVTNWTSLLE
jgi:Tol biopolymer transport system component